MESYVRTDGKGERKGQMSCSDLMGVKSEMADVNTSLSDWYKGLT